LCIHESASDHNESEELNTSNEVENDVETSNIGRKDASSCACESVSDHIAIPEVNVNVSTSNEAKNENVFVAQSPESLKELPTKFSFCHAIENPNQRVLLNCMRKL